MEDTAFSLYSLLIVSILALLVPLVVNRIRAIRIPIVVGEIVVGVIVGKSGFHLIQESQWLQFLQFFGLAYLMFVSGLEIDFQALRPGKSDGGSLVSRWLTNAPVFAVLTCAVTFGLSYLLSIWLQQQQMIKSPLFVSLLITTTSLTIVVPVLKEYDLLQNSFGQLLMASAMFADFVTMLLISVAASLFQGGLSASVLLVFVLIVLLVVLYFVFQRFSKHRSLENLAHGTAQLGIRASLALMIIFIVLSQTLGVQVILGTFLAGILVGLINRQEKTDIYHKLDAIGFGFLIPIFFIMVGVNFDIRSLLNDPKALLLFPLLLVATYLFKGLPVLLLKLRYPWRQTLSGTALLTTQMSVTVAAAAVGLKIGAISPGVDTAIVLVAMLTAIISPVVFGKLLPQQMQAQEKRFVIVGKSPSVKLLVEQVKERNQEVTWIEREAGGGALNDDLFAELGVGAEETKALVAYTGDDLFNVELCKQAVGLGIASVVCYVQDVQLYQEYSQKQQFVVVNPQLAVVTLVDQLMNYPISTKLLKAPAEMQIREIRLVRHALHGVKVRDMKLPGNLLLMSIVREGQQIVPHGQTELQVGDTVIVVGQKEDILEFRQMARGGGIHGQQNASQ